MQARESEKFELYNGVDEDWDVCWVMGRSYIRA